ncbi:hypothetical protein PTKIN_Ptkin13bG0204800 [Pterospermum kingtungense]
MEEFYLLGKYPRVFYEFISVSKSSFGLTRSVESANSSNKRKRKENKPDSDQGSVEEINGNNKKVRLIFSSSVEKPNPESTSKDKTKQHLAPAVRFCEKVRKQTSPEDYLRLLKFLYGYGTGKISKVRLKAMVADYFPYFLDDFLDILKFYNSSSTPLPSEEEKISILGKKKPDKNRSTIITPSYHKLLPENLSGDKSSGIDEVGKEVLNFSCLSKGSYSYNSKVRPIDPYQEKLNKYEDELFVNDMLEAWRRSTKENATSLLNAIEFNGEIERPIDVNKHLTGYNIRFIQKMYGDMGLKMVDYLCQSPETVLPVIIRRLERMESPS